MHTVLLFARHDVGKVVALGVGLIRVVEHVFRAEFDTHLAPLASLRNDVDLAMWGGDLFNIDRDTCKYLRHVNWHSFRTTSERLILANKNPTSVEVGLLDTILSTFSPISWRLAIGLLTQLLLGATLDRPSAERRIQL